MSENGRMSEARGRLLHNRGDGFGHSLLLLLVLLLLVRSARPQFVVQSTGVRVSLVELDCFEKQNEGFLAGDRR